MIAIQAVSQPEWKPVGLEELGEIASLRVACEKKDSKLALAISARLASEMPFLSPVLERPVVAMIDDAFGGVDSDEGAEATLKWQAERDAHPEKEAFDAEVLKRFYLKRKIEAGKARLSTLCERFEKFREANEAAKQEAELDDMLAEMVAKAKAKPKPAAEIVVEKPNVEESKPPGLPALAPRQLPADPRDVIYELNKYHAVIENIGGKSVIACLEPSRLHQDCWEIIYQNMQNFLLRYSNRQVFVEALGETVALGKYWLGHKERRQFRSVIFLPGHPHVVDGNLNLWQRWGVSAKQGDWSLIESHIRNVIADGKTEWGEYVIRWIAWSIQNPDRQAEVALVLVGQKGTGKGTLAVMLEAVFRPHARRVSNTESFVGKFNAQLQDCVLLVADAAFFGGDKKAVGMLQALITEDRIRIEPKGIDAYEIPNCLHAVLLAEPGWIIPAGRFERRYAVFAVRSLKRGDKGYFRELRAQADSGGVEAMLWDLQRLPLDGWHPREIPESLLNSPALQKQQRRTLPPEEQWYFMLLQEGCLPGPIINGHPLTCRTSHLVDHAKASVKRLSFDFSSMKLRSFLIDEDCIGLTWTKFEGNKFNGWTAPPLEECREAWERLYGKTDWDTKFSEWRKWDVDLKDWVMLG